MRTRIVAATAAGVLGVGGLALAVPALGATAGSQDGGGGISRVEAVREALSGLVRDKTITQGQADKVAEALKDVHGGSRRGPRGGGPGGMTLSVAADTLRMSEDDLRSALRSGTSPAEVAKARDVGVDTLVDALVEAARKHLAEAVEAGHLTQEQADRRGADLEDRVTGWVEGTHQGRGRGHRGGFGGGPRSGDSSAAPEASTSD